MIFQHTQEYVEDLQQLLTSAKHPRSVALLQKALTEASQTTPLLNGELEATSSTAPAESADVSAEPEMKPLKRLKDSSISMAKINNYGTSDPPHTSSKWDLSIADTFNCITSDGEAIIRQPLCIQMCPHLNREAPTSNLLIELHPWSISDQCIYSGTSK